MTDPLFEDIDSRITVNLISTSIVSNGEQIHIRGHIFYDTTQYVIIFNTYKQDYEQILEQVESTERPDVLDHERFGQTIQAQKPSG